jgi:hypothetical protein
MKYTPPKAHEFRTNIDNEGVFKIAIYNSDGLGNESGEVLVFTSREMALIAVLDLYEQVKRT